MHPHSNNRRRFIKASLAIPILSNLTWMSPIAMATPGDRFEVPETIYDELFRIYGHQANNILGTDIIELKVPDIAENGMEVPVNVSGDKGLVSSLAIFIAQNPKPFTSLCTFHEGCDLAVRLRVKLMKTSDVYIVAQTSTGLVGIKKLVKVTMGCGGG